MFVFNFGPLSMRGKRSRLLYSGLLWGLSAYSFGESKRPRRGPGTHRDPGISEVQVLARLREALLI